MKIKFVKDYAQFKAGDVKILNVRFTKSAIDAGAAVLADGEEPLTEPVIDGKGSDTEEKKSEVKPKRKPRKSTPSK